MWDAGQGWRKGQPVLCCGRTVGAIQREEKVEKEPADLALTIPTTDAECICGLLLAAQNKHGKGELLSLQAEDRGHGPSPKQSSSKR